MPLIRTPLEDKVLKIKSRNYSDILSLALFLQRRTDIDYVAASSFINLPTVGSIGEGAGSYKVFNAFSPTSVSQGTFVTISGRASYSITDGKTTNYLAANTINIIIDSGEKDYENISVSASNIIKGTGVFTLDVPTSKLSKGIHKIYILAKSANSKDAVKLEVSGVSDGIRNLTIT